MQQAPANTPSSPWPCTSCMRSKTGTFTAPCPEPVIPSLTLYLELNPPANDSRL